VDLALSITKLGGIAFKGNKGFSLAPVLGQLGWFPASGVQ